MLVKPKYLKQLNQVDKLGRKKTGQGAVRAGKRFI